ncbi:MAG TPA: DUF2207 domain-containing protein, partial [Phototrophicaceae bacterium]|nr:DUF2207 domain-containing protein [Phototrophicaceae bacterium]
RGYEGGDQLWWIAIPQEKYGFSVGESTITVDLPSGYAPREGVDPVVTYGVAGDVQVSGTHIVATATEPIGPNDVFEIRVQYPHNPEMRISSWQASYDQHQTIKPILDIVMIGLSLLIGLLGPLGVFYLWYSRGRDPKIGPVPEFLSELPSNLPPAVVGAMIDEKADLRDVLSTMIDLSRRGYIVIEESRREGFFGLGGGSDFTFKRTDRSVEDLRGYEQNFINKLFAGQMTRTMDSLKNKFYMHIPALQRDLYQEIVKEGLFKANPDNTRNGWSGLGGTILVIGGGLGYLAFQVIDSVSFSLILPPIAIGLTGLVLSVVGQYMPAKTRKGAEEAAKWKAFRHYLYNLEKYRQVEDATDQFEAFLPYAVAFGIDRAWIHKFSKLTTMPVPIWYYPTYRGGYWSGGYHAGTPLPRGGGLPSAHDVLPGEIAHAGSSGGLNDLAGGLSGGLDSISSGLTSMLNSAGSVMNSRPQSSGSWSGGGRGFSGGGSRGGGSGGGSRGFG